MNKVQARNCKPLIITKPIQAILEATIVTYAVDSLIMKRLRTWNFKSCYLDGTIPGSDSIIEKRINCKLCQ